MSQDHRNTHDEGTRLVAAPDQGATGDIQETHFFRNFFPTVELGWLNVPVNLHMPLRGPHVLAESDYVNIDLTKL